MIFWAPLDVLSVKLRVVLQLRPVVSQPDESLQAVVIRMHVMMRVRLSAIRTIDLDKGGLSVSTLAPSYYSSSSCAAAEPDG